MTVFAKDVGVVCGDLQFTFEELGQRCGRLAAGLKALGVQKGDRVAYLASTPTSFSKDTTACRKWER